MIISNSNLLMLLHKNLNMAYNVHFFWFIVFTNLGWQVCKPFACKLRLRKKVNSAYKHGKYAQNWLKSLCGTALVGGSQSSRVKVL